MFAFRGDGAGRDPGGNEADGDELEQDRQAEDALADILTQGQIVARSQRTVGQGQERQADAAAEHHQISGQHHKGPAPAHATAQLLQHHRVVAQPGDPAHVTSPLVTRRKTSSRSWPASWNWITRKPASCRAASTSLRPGSSPEEWNSRCTRPGVWFP